MTATLTKWYEEHGRHEIIAGGKKVALPSTEHRLVLRADDVNRERQHDLDELGIAKTAREEKKRARDAKLAEQTKNDEMMKLYREHVLGEKPQTNMVPLGAIKPAAKKESEEEAVGSFGD
jgi:7,8-dihydro-6-hydroxymethylpterin dimethyltransferase